ncbi:Antigen peptide transporter 2 [Triplophysa tibetana]|uniref:Antigen peptide transporter 2 n=1 Tax=Triplophysa tibetana TaxID=1572043 RepID=A0A5A9PYX9_9TELE|nr:Antigen peptide transporter 2 [Triplophysa tibetana]
MIPKAHSIISITTLSAHVYLLCCDLFLWACVWSVLLRLDGEGSLDLRCLWAFRVISWAVLYLLSKLVADNTVQPFLKQWVALLSFLPAVFDTVQTMLQGTVRGFSPVPDPGMVVLSSATSTLIYVVMETAFPHGGSVKGSRNKKKDEEAKALLMRVIRYSRPDYLHLGAAFIFLSLAALFETFIPYSIGKVVDHLSGKYQHSNFLWAIGLMALCSLGSSMFGGLRGGMFMCSLSRLNKRIRHMLFQNLMKQDINFFEENKPGSLTSRLISDTDKMGRSVAMNVNVLLRSLVKTCGMLYFMLGLSWQLTLLTCIEMPLLAFIQNAYNNLYQKTSREIQDCNAEIADLATSVIGSMKTVRSCNGEAQEQRRYERALKRKLQVLTRKGISSNVHLLIRRFISVGLKVAMLIQGRNLISTGQLSSGSLLAFVFYQKDMVTNMKQLVYIYGDMLNTVGSAVKVFQLLDRKPRMREEEGLAPEKLKGKLTFEKVTFSYSSRPDNKALESVTLEVSPGKVTALVGPSGGGKTSCVAMVSQDPVLFSGSVRYNIEYGLKDCTMERVIEAARQANAHDFIRNLEQEYNTDVGECGDQLSAGQKQCIALARALIRNPQILILDEATSHMDCSTQQAIQYVLNNITDQTVLVIAHRLETVEKAHHIIFMEDGKVMEEGTHQQLMANEKGRYYRLKEKLFQTEPDSRN